MQRRNRLDDVNLLLDIAVSNAPFSTSTLVLLSQEPELTPRGC